MMREVVVHGDAAHDAAHFESSLDAAELGEGGKAHVHRDAGVARRGERGERVETAVATILHAVGGPAHDALRRAAVRDLAVRRDAPRGGRRAFWRCELGAGEILDLGPAAAREHAGEAVVLAVYDEPTAARHRADEMMELRLDRRQVGEDVGVIEFEVVEDGGARAVMDELRALVEKCGVVLVGFDDEERAVGKPCGHAEVHWHAADQESRVEPCALQDPGEHRCRRRLAVRSGDREYPLVAQNVLAQPLRAGDVRSSGVEQRFGKWIAARHDVADHEHIGIPRHGVELRRIDSLR